LVNNNVLHAKLICYNINIYKHSFMKYRTNNSSFVHMLGLFFYVIHPLYLHKKDIQFYIYIKYIFLVINLIKTINI